MTTEKLYPDIPDLSILEDKLSRSRAIEIINKQKELQKDQTHYRKLRKKWKRAANIFKGVAIGLSTGLAVTGAVVGGVATSGVAIPVIIPVAIAGAGALEGVITGSIGFAYIRKRVHRFNAKYQLVTEYVNKMYHFYHRAIEDKVISVEEMSEFRKLVSEYEKAIGGVNDVSDNDIHMDQLKVIAERDAKAEVKNELIAELKEKAKQRIKTDAHLN